MPALLNSSECQAVEKHHVFVIGVTKMKISSDKRKDQTRMSPFVKIGGGLDLVKEELGKDFLRWFGHVTTQHGRVLGLQLNVLKRMKKVDVK